MGFTIFLAVFSTVLLGASINELAPQRRRAILRRLAELETYDPHAPTAARSGPVDEWRRAALRLLRRIGSRKDVPQASTHARLLAAGYRHPQMEAIYRGAATAGLAVGILLCLLIGTIAHASPAGMILLCVYGALAGFLAPRFYINSRVKNRQRELQRALPDALDLLVVCVEAGLGLNNALQRVAHEIGGVSRVLAHELQMVNLEIRAGAPRLEALKNLGERTGLDDLRSLVAMLVQTERFGTPVADALRAYADSLRVKRRQRAEEAAAKTTIKLLFPLVFFIFPPLYIVILGPAVLMMIRSMSGVN
jgi:tight adherence protein C